MNGYNSGLNGKHIHNQPSGMAPLGSNSSIGNRLPKKLSKRPLISTTLAAIGFLVISLTFISIVHISSAIAQNDANILARKGNAALVHRNNQKAIRALSEALSVGSMPIYNKASILNDRGLAFTRLKNYERALKDFNKAIEAFPEYAIAYNNRGLLLHQMGFYNEAIKDFNRAIALHPKQGATFHNRANSLLKAGAETTAFKDYGRALDLLNDKSAPHLARGQIHWSHQRRYAALRELNLALSHNSNQPEALYNRGEVFLSLEETNNAIKDIAKATDLDPDNSRYQMTLATIYLEKGQYNSAKISLTKVLEKQPLNAVAIVMRGRALGARGKHPKALNDLDQAVSLKGSAAAFAERALIRAKTGLFDLAAQDMDAAIQKAPNSARTWIALGKAAELSDLGNHAERYYREALKFDKKNKVAMAGLIELGILEQEFAEFDLNEETTGWTLHQGTNKQYYATNPQYTRLKVHLDLYGPGKPKILEWSELSGDYKGFGLLRYDAGSKDKAKAYEQVSIINLKKQKVLSIEPYRWGNKVAEWQWNQTEVIVKDPDGIENKVALRAPIRRKQPKVAVEQSWGDNGFWVSGPRQRARGPRKRVRVRRRKKKSIFGIFGF